MEDMISKLLWILTVGFFPAQTLQITTQNHVEIQNFRAMELDNSDYFPKIGKHGICNSLDAEIKRKYSFLDEPVQIKRDSRDLNEIGWKIKGLFTHFPPIIFLLMPTSWFSVILAVDYFYIAGANSYSTSTQIFIIPLSVVLWLATIISVIGFFIPFLGLSTIVYQLTIVASIYSVGFFLWEIHQNGLFQMVKIILTGFWYMARGFFF